MSIDLSVRFTVKSPNVEKSREWGQDELVACFRHAAIAAVVQGWEVEMEVDQFGQEGDMRTYWCEFCAGKQGI